MTAPRFVAPGQTYLLTRRCSERRAFLHPKEEATRIFLYCLAEAAERYGIVVIAWVAMSNHYHAVVEDPRGVLPEFLAHFHKMTARSLNALWGRTENLWSSMQASVVRLVEPCDVLDKVVYTLANPVEGHLVDRALAWPGTSSFAALDGRLTRARRPRSFFSKDGVMPAAATLVAQTPTGWPGGREAWAQAVRDGVRAKEAAARRERALTGKTVVGSRAIRHALPGSRATTPETPSALRPELACRNRARRIGELGALRAFRLAYASARDLFIKGFAVLFPFGTYKLVQELGALVEPAPA